MSYLPCCILALPASAALPCSTPANSATPLPPLPLAVPQLVVEQVLKREKWQVVKAFDGLQALHHIEAATVLPDIILLDIMMPNMNGFELCTKCVGECWRMQAAGEVQGVWRQ